MNSITGAEETYSRSLLSSGNGFALWDVTGSHLRGASRLEEAAVLSDGLSIGDVGMLDPQGQFVFVFNIFTPAAEAIHPGNVPEDFETLQPPLDTAAEVKTLPDYFKPGSIIASEGVNVNKISKDPL